MNVILMEFSNGGHTEAEVFASEEALKKWFKDYYFDGYDKQDIDEVLEDIDNRENNLGDYDFSGFSAVVYYNYPVHT